MRVEVLRGTAEELHGLPEEPDVATLTWFEVAQPALVLGSTQSVAVVDEVACASAGVAVTRRRSGGGAVLLVPGEVAWFDVTIPRGDPRWHDDIGLAPLWVGRVVVRALESADVHGLSVHEGPMVQTAWSKLVCFAGVGPGEVLQGGRKVAGLSQRRTRASARFQVAMYRRWDPAALIALLAPPAPTVSELLDGVATADLQLDRLVDALAISTN